MQAQPAVKVSPQQGQLPAPQQQRVVAQANPSQPWHSLQTDPELRSQMMNSICELFSKRKSNVTSDWHKKLPEFVRKLEEQLYRAARSKEEYTDPATLEQRLQSVARNIVGNKSNAQQQQQTAQLRQAQLAQQQRAAAGIPTLSGANGMPGMVQPGYGPLPGVGIAGGGVPGMYQQQMLSGQALPNGPATYPNTGMMGQPGTAGGQAGYGPIPPGMQTGSAGGRVPSPVVGAGDATGQPGFQQGGQLTQGGVMLRNQAGLPTGAPVMSNGAPVLLRNQRGDWGSQGSGAMMAAAPGQLQGKMMPTGVPGQVPVSSAPGMMVPQKSSGVQGMVPVGGSDMAQTSQQPLSGMVSLNHIQQGQQPGMMQVNNMVPVNSGGASSMSGSLPPAQTSVQQQQQAAAGGSQQYQQGSVGPSSSAQGQAQGSEPGSASTSSNPATTDAQQQKLIQQKLYIQKQQRWLVFLRHCAKCRAPDGQCPTYGPNCNVAKSLWQHILQCHDPQCTYPRCGTSRDLLKHHQKCTNAKCPVCVPVKAAIQKQRHSVSEQWQLRQQMAAQQGYAQQYMLPNGQLAQLNMMAGQMGPMMPSPTMQQRGMQMMPTAMDMQQQQMMAGGSSGGMMMHPHTNGAVKVEGTNMMMVPVNNMGSMAPGVSHAQSMQYQHQMMAAHQAQAMQLKRSASGAAVEAAAKRARTTVDANNHGTSLLEAFTADEIRTHLWCLLNPGATYLPPPNKLNLGKAELMDENTCKACRQKKLTFDPPSLYCTCCGQKIKRNQVYYMTPARIEVKGYWCHPCFSEVKEQVELDGLMVRKADIEKKKNDEELEEPWVQCDACGDWVHQVCGLFNKGRNDEDMSYHCPWCLLEGLKSGSRQRITVRPQAMLEARDLSTCHLSNFLEERLSRALQEERAARSAGGGASPSDVPPAEELTVRVINNVVKTLETKPHFADAFKADGYPERFTYKQKVIILYQRQDGVDVALYCLYVQEFGDDNPPPNRRTVYLSYLDSVKYFRPEEAQSVTRGTALRTMVYHELLLGYLHYIKACGFNSFYIWACPPLQGDDYILYCHPGKQKTPRSDRLREWYHVMLRRAKEEGCVTYVSNLWDTYFPGGKDHRLDKCSTMHLPYFDGDYWPGEAEGFLSTISEAARKEAKKGGKASGSAKARSKGTKGKRYGSGPTSTDEQLMTRLGEAIQGMKEDFIVVHLREPCSFCREYISGERRYYHPSPPTKAIKAERTFEGISLDNPGSQGARVTPLSRFQLCERCYSTQAAAQSVGKPTDLPSGIALSELVPEPLPATPATNDPNPVLENEFFDTRQAFLSLCQGNHYQFDALRRAKHSSMMVLYHLHNPTAPAFSCTCNTCNAEIEPGHGWRCTVCSDFDQCSTCKANPQCAHPHPMAPHARKLDETRQRLTDDERKQRQAQLQRTLQLLEHASMCESDACASTGCKKVKAMFSHAISCQQKHIGGCMVCRRMWALIRTHASHCARSDCKVPRCRDFRAAARRNTARVEAQRREAYHAMLRKQQQLQMQSQMRQQQQQLAG